MTDCYLRYPHLVGEQLVFVADDDIWLARAAGGTASRLTADRCPVSRPRLSPDGRTVAWLSIRAGTPEAFAMPVTGGEPRQLSYFGSEFTSFLGFDPAGRLVLATAAGQPVRSDRWAWAIDPDPAADPVPRRLPYGPIVDISWASSGTVVVNTGLYRDPAHWKRYRGGAAGRLWLDSSGGGEFAEILADLPGPKTSPVAIGDRYAFLADFEGHGNVYSVDATGADLRRHTDHQQYYARQLAGDGSRLVYQHAGQIWLLPDLSPNSQPRRLEIELAGPRLGRAPVELPVGKHLGDYLVDETGRASVVEIRGNVVWLTHRNGPAIALAATAGVRHRLPVILTQPTGGGAPAVAYVTSAGGPDAVELLASDGSVRRFGAGELGRVLMLTAAPDGSRLAVATHDGRLLLVATSDGTVTELLTNPHGDISGLSWSPDSGWLAIAVPERTPETSSIRLCQVATGDLIAITGERFVDTEPVFSLDGKYLAFLSVRTFDPIYDAQVFDLSFAMACRPFLVTLAADTPSPFDPQLAGAAVTEQPAAGPPAEPAAVRVDPAGIDRRVLPFPVRAGRYAKLRAVADGFVWTDQPIAGELGDSRLPEADIRPSLQRWDFGKGSQLELCSHLDEVRASGDGKRLVIQNKDKLLLVLADRAPAEQEPNDSLEIDLARIRLTVEPPAEWAQMLDETGQLMREHYCSPDLAGIDWEAAVAKYRSLLPAIATRDDLSDLLWEINGETGTSHAYETPPKPEPNPLLRPAFLGADLDRDPDGRWLVSRVIQGDNSARAARSPLSAPSAGVQAGDELIAVNGRPVGPPGPAPLLRGTADKPVELRVARDGRQRSVVVVPLAGELELRYLDWVASRRGLVHAASDRRIGYLHIPDMVATGWAAFHRDLSVEMGRDALIVDTRNNGGGHTSELVIEKLSRSPLAWVLPRHRSPVSYPRNVPLGPMVALANEWAGSDGDIVNAGFKALGLGPVIGRRTWGGVVGIDGRYELVDGTRVTQPRYAFWFNSVGWGVENHGVDPDRVVETPPQAWAAGADPVLDAGIEYLLGELARRPARRSPDFADRPKLRSPELPPRR
ncbi:MAG: S41 family peptidase [Jatrophihabitantaceae bacterium]